MKIVILDAKTLGDDIEFSVFNKLGDVSVYLSLIHISEPTRH